MKKTLNKEELYMLYVEEKMSDKQIAEEYNKRPEEIKETRKKCNISINQRFLADFEEIEKMYKKFKYKDEIEEILQEYVGLPKISDLYIPILEILKDNNPHNVKEMWKLADKNYKITEKEISICGDIENPTLYYRINWAVYKMLKEKTIEKENIREYKITEKGIQKLNKETKKEEKQEICQTIEINPDEQYKKLKEITNVTKGKPKINNTKKQKERKAKKINYEKQNIENINLGKFCERMVYLKEIERIKNEGRKDLLKKIIWVSKDEGDGAGYDIKSLRKIGDEYEPIYIEVKGTNTNKIDNFIVTINEIRASIEYKDRYYICQIINAQKDNPQFKYTQGEIDKNFKLDAIQFQASQKEE